MMGSERGRIRTCDPCLKRVAKLIANHNLHVQLTPCTAQKNQIDTDKTFVWVPGRCPTKILQLTAEDKDLERIRCQ
jgi:hypothetical protein